MTVNLELSTADMIAIIILICLLGLAVRIIFGFFNDKKK